MVEQGGCLQPMRFYTLLFSACFRILWERNKCVLWTLGSFSDFLESSARWTPFVCSNKDAEWSQLCAQLWSSNPGCLLNGSSHFVRKVIVKKDWNKNWRFIASFLSNTYSTFEDLNPNLLSSLHMWTIELTIQIWQQLCVIRYLNVHPQTCLLSTPLLVIPFWNQTIKASTSEWLNWNFSAPPQRFPKSFPSGAFLNYLT